MKSNSSRSFTLQMSTPASWLGRLARLAHVQNCHVCQPRGARISPVRDHIIKQALAGQRCFSLPRPIRLEVNNHRRMLDWLRVEGIAYELQLREAGDFAVIVRLP